MPHNSKAQREEVDQLKPEVSLFEEKQIKKDTKCVKGENAVKKYAGIKKLETKFCQRKVGESEWKIVNS
jgi:hypothetical protein